MKKRKQELKLGEGVIGKSCKMMKIINKELTMKEQAEENELVFGGFGPSIALKPMSSVLLKKPTKLLRDSVKESMLNMKAIEDMSSEEEEEDGMLSPNILSIPIKTGNGSLEGVVEARQKFIRKGKYREFTKKDEGILNLIGRISRTMLTPKKRKDNQMVLVSNFRELIKFGCNLILLTTIEDIVRLAQTELTKMLNGDKCRIFIKNGLSGNSRRINLSKVEEPSNEQQENERAFFYNDDWKIEEFSMKEGLIGNAMTKKKYKYYLDCYKESDYHRKILSFFIF
jgi:hypothetical protein